MNNQLVENSREAVKSTASGGWFGRLAPTLAGVVAGIVSALAISRASRPEVTPAPVSTSHPLTVAAPSNGGNADRARLRALESRLDHLEARPESTAGAGDRPKQDPSPEKPDPAAAREMFVGKLAQHQQEPVNAAWARSAAGSFRTDLDSLGTEQGFSVVSMDCRSASCVGVVEWPSFDVARNKFIELVHHGYSMNCSKGMSLAPPSDPALPYRTEILFGCDDSVPRAP